MIDDLERFKGTPCLNCGTVLDGNFCPVCGQRATDLKQTFWGLLTEYLEYGLSLDSNFARSVITLLKRPGHLTVEYIEGRRARYFSPIRLYLLMSVLFFWSLTLMGTSGVVIDNDEDDADRTTGQAVEQTGAEATLAQETPEAEAQQEEVATQSSAALTDTTTTSFWGRFGRRLEAGAQKVGERPDLFVRQLFSNMSKVMFVLVPLFALLVRLLNLRRRRPYLHFMVFALHIHAVFFMITTVFNVSARFFEVLEDPLQLIMLLLFPIYIIVAMRTAFGGSWVRTWGKVILLMPAYGMCLSLGIMLVAIAQLLLIS